MRTVEWIGGSSDPTRSADRMHPVAVAAVVAVGILAAHLIGRLARRWGEGRLGLTAISAAARGEGRGPSMRATALAASGTWSASASMASIGREVAILDMGGTLGNTLGRGRPALRPALAAAGVAAAFASAYHAPIAAVIYVDDHLGVRTSRRPVVYVVAAAALSHVVTVGWWGGHAIFPGRTGGWTSAIVLAAVGLVPAVIGSRIFLELRSRSSPRRHDRRVVLAATIIISAAFVAIFPVAAGNGMEGLRHAATTTTLSVAIALGLAKIVATTSALRAGVPGGVFPPSFAVAGGWALLAYVGLDAIGVPLPAERWDGMLIAMAVGVAVGLGSPILAAVVVAEMAGDLMMIPLCAAIAALAWLIDGQILRHLVGRWRVFGGQLRNEDG